MVITLRLKCFATILLSIIASIAAGSSLPITVFYTPSAVGSETGALDLTYTQVIDNGVTLTGNGITPTSLVVSTTPSEVPQATQNAAYQTTLSASGGSGSYTWALASGS